MDTKLIKDPVHGYIRLKDSYIKNIVDSSEFQRLRNIRQTSYDSLYPGSSHNRFIHSLGVYYLGHKAFKELKKNASDLFPGMEEKEWICLQSTFDIACLLHDIGHTPFSHSGEDFLLIKKEADKFNIIKGALGQTSQPEIEVLYNQLLEIMQEMLDEKDFKAFLADFSYTVSGSVNYDGKAVVAKPHEIMSVIVAISVYTSFMKKLQVDIDLFARAILGITYKKKSVSSKGIRNALIQLLNSSIIDVDRLDYIIRDTQMSGFDNTTIDVERLLESVTIIKKKDGNYTLAYKKNALSTIDNVIISYDAERRWIQAHPVVIYDSYLVEQCLAAIEKHFKMGDSQQGIFQRDALGQKGVRTANGLQIKLLNDGDCLFLMKQLSNGETNGCVEEYLERKKRKQPIWKSEEEFRMIMDQLPHSEQESFHYIFGANNEEINGTSIGSVLNDERIKEIEHEIEKNKKDQDMNEEDKDNHILILQKQLFWLKRLEKYFVQRDMNFEMYNKKAKTFQSKINELSSQGLQIRFERLKEDKDISKVSKVYKMIEYENRNKNLIYWYIHKSKKFEFLDFVEFLKETSREFEVEFRRD